MVERWRERAHIIKHTIRLYYYPSSLHTRLGDSALSLLLPAFLENGREKGREIDSWNVDKYFFLSLHLSHERVAFSPSSSSSSDSLLTHVVQWLVYIHVYVCVPLSFTSHKNTLLLFSLRQSQPKSEYCYFTLLHNFSFLVFFFKASSHLLVYYIYTWRS